MEKYSQFRDRGSGIAPFLPIPAEPSGLYLPVNIFLFLFRLPILFALLFAYFLVLQWLPIGTLGKKAIFWLMLGTPGIWWIDLQIDGVKRGSLSSNSTRIPHSSTVIASSRTSPLDALYLAAIFDPIFTVSYPTTRLIQPLSLLGILNNSFAEPQMTPPGNAELVDIPALIAANPHRIIVVFPECTTTNGRGILKFSPSLLTAGPKTKIFPISLRYTAADITTPIPRSYMTFAWNLLSKPTHCIRVRIAEYVYNNAGNIAAGELSPGRSGLTNVVGSASDEDTLDGSGSEDLTASDKRLLDKTAEALARLGRVKRVGLGVREKAEFVRAWARKRT